jgi:hypothetical protein
MATNELKKYPSYKNLEKIDFACGQEKSYIKGIDLLYKGPGTEIVLGYVTREYKTIFDTVERDIETISISKKEVTILDKNYPLEDKGTYSDSDKKRGTEN